MGAPPQRRRDRADRRGRDDPAHHDRCRAAILCPEGGNGGDRAAEHLAPLPFPGRGEPDDGDAAADRAPDGRCRGSAYAQRRRPRSQFRRESSLMYFDRRLWQLMRGLRGRILLAIVIGLAASALGIARFALLGVLLARVFTGAGFAPIAEAAIGVALAVLLRGLLDHSRTIIAHHTASRVQEDLRGKLYDKIAELGPAWFAGERTGGVMLSLVDGVEQLQSFFGQYLPQVCVAPLTPLAIFAFIAWWDVPVATVMLVCALLGLVLPSAFHRWDRRASLSRQQAFKAF